MFVVATASGTARIIGPPLPLGAAVGVDTSPAMYLFYFFARLAPCNNVARDKIAPSRRAARERIARREMRFFMRTCDDVGLRITRTRLEGIRIARAYAYKCTRAHIGAIISHHASAYIIPATESTPAAVGFACCLPLSRQRSRFNGPNAFNGF